MPTPVDDEHARLLAAVGWSASPFWKVWAKLEILLGLAAAGAGLFYGTHLVSRPAATFGPDEWLAPLALAVLGGYLALAGHRSHLYQSNNRLAAYLASLTRRPVHPGADP